ncbi:ABC transporter, ATP-binding protein [Ancylostoma ceylanicum]|uniref:ABC transporter, ATP-binding protein n=1 Tax=Ancylostoma ceylanicum TaxID=53326 RepID=A0A0D6LL23_9BILA|nr:ABC transporter, ATP-binding protein [Ancylostoma ceylanicum]
MDTKEFSIDQLPPLGNSGTNFKSHYDSKGFPSAGILPFLHSFLCSFSNTCHLSPTTGDETQFIHNGTDPDESLLVDFLYYSSLQLGWIGENPVEFSRLLGSLTRAIHIIARMNGTQIGLPTARQLFLPSYNLTGKLEELGMSRNAAEVVAESRLTPEFFVEAYRYAEELSSMSAVALFFSAVSSVPIFCNETLFSASFLLPPEANLTAEDHQSLCRVTPLDLLNLNQTEIMKNMVLPFSGTPSAGNQSKPTSPRDLLEPLMISIPLLQQQPLYEGFLKRSDNFNLTFANISSLIFCGGNPFDTSTDGLGPLPTNVKTPFDELKNNLVEFIEKIVPGRQEHDKQFCHGVWVRDDLNCSALESAFMQRLRPLFIGYILVTPPSPVVEEMIDMNILAFLRSYEEHRDLPQWMKSLEFLLEHVFAPPSDPYSFGGVTKNLTETVNKYITCFLTDRFVLVANESAMEETALCLTDYQQYFSGIVIVNMTDNATEFEPLTTYKIRHLPTLSDNTRGYVDSPRRLFDRNMPFNDLKYLTYGFSFLQEAIDRAIIAIRANSTRPVGMYSQQEPYPCINFDTFNVAGFFALFVILSYIIPAALLVKNIVHEKELRLKEQMRIMGLGDMVHLWSWAIISLVLNIISTFVIVLITKFGHLLKIDFWLLFVFLSLFAMSSIAMCLLLSTFFSNANISTAATCILSVRARSATFTQFTLIFPQTTLGYGMAMLAYAAESDEATWSDIKSIRLEAYDVGLVECMVAFAVEIVTFIILAWYKSAVSPGIYGVSLPWYFCLTRSYWCPRSVSVSDHDPPYDSQPAGDTFDVEPSYLNMTVHISGMSKVYGNGTKAKANLAQLDQLSMRLYEDQITALLGHNGAGKTTTMSILCGLYSPSSGSAHVYGMDIRSEMQGVRDVLGVCPQYNVLFSHLTVAEQLKLFAALKGTPDDELKHEVDEILDAVSLVDKADALASTLSGGMKRRLSIGIALVGGSRFVILDEPTAGVDVNSRKEIWTLLQNNKKGRTILLSTHHMDEADILSDRIAILSEGRLISLGSSIFLKNKFGDSFQMFACKKERSIDYTAVITRITTEATVPIRLSDETEEELVFSIPITTDSYKLEKFFSFFDSHKDAYHLGEYGISAPTLQEIFVRLSPQREYIVPRHKAGILGKLKRTFRGGQVQTDQQHLMRTPASGNAIAEAGGSRDASPAMFDEELMPAPLRGWELARSHTKAILRSRCQYTVRSKKHVLFEVILPICLLFLCELYAKIQFSDTTSSYVSSQPELPLIAEMYGNNTRSYISVWDRNTSSLSHQILNSFEEPPDMGTRCVNNVPVFERKLPKKVSSWMRKEKSVYVIHHSMLISPSKRSQDYESYVFRQLVSGCDYEAGNGTFNWNVNETEIPYNEDLTCTCSENHFWNCTAVRGLPPGFGPIDHAELDYGSVGYVVQEHFADENGDTMVLEQLLFRTSFEAISFFFGEYYLERLGGFSLGHTSLRARTSAEVQLEIQGWHTLLAGLNESAIALNVSISTSEAPEIYDPFLKNMTMSDFVAGVLGSMETKDIVKAWFNNKMYTSLPVYTGFLSNALLRIESKDTDPSDLGIITINHPMNQTVKGSFDSEGRRVGRGSTVLKTKKLIVFRIVLIMLVLCVIPAGFTVFLVEDRICDAYHLQLVSGLSRRTYWMTGYVFDMIVRKRNAVVNFLIMCKFVSTVVSIYTASLVAILLIYVIFGVKEFAYSFEAICCFFLDPTLIAPHTICSIVFLLLPQYNLGMAIFRGSFVFQLIQIGENYLKELHRPDLVSELPIPSLLEWNLMGKHCLCLVIHTFAAALTLFVLERQPFGFLRRWEQIRTQRLLECSKGVSDEDVIAEMRKVDEIENASDNPLIVKDLAKAYTKTNLAVRSVSFAVDRGECFGLLGLNGAGKTTTFAMLTQKIRPGAGSVRIHGRSMVIGDRSSFDQVGYCPQFDALNMKLTTIENIELFARIRGIPETHIKPDEPSAGMDPGSQQFLWKVIDQLRKSGKAVVITSHSMEECEALCTRIAIMDKGQIRCIGSKQHLKNKFGEGHSLTVKMKSQSDARLAGEFVLERLKGAKIESIHCSTLFLHIDREISSISGIYRVVNQLKKQFSVEDFSLSQSTLAEVFHSLAASSSSSVSSGHTVSTAETDLTD